MSPVGLPRRVQHWKPPKCPFTDEWIRKTAYIHAMDDDSARNTKKIMQLFRIDSPSDDHTGPRKSDRER